MNKEAIEFVESKKRFCENMIEMTQDYTAPIYKDMVKQNRIYEFILSKLKSDEENYIKGNNTLKQALNEIRERIEPLVFWDMCTIKGTILKPILQIIDKALGDDEKYH